MLANKREIAIHETLLINRRMVANIMLRRIVEFGMPVFGQVMAEAMPKNPAMEAI